MLLVLLVNKKNVYLTAIFSFCLMSAEELPMYKVNVPGSSFQPLSFSLQNMRSSRLTDIVAVAVAPGFTLTLAKAFSSYFGLSTVHLSSPTYSCTTSLASIVPLFVTGTLTVHVLSPSRATDALPYVKVT